MLDAAAGTLRPVILLLCRRVRSHVLWVVHKQVVALWLLICEASNWLLILGQIHVLNRRGQIEVESCFPQFLVRFVDVIQH